MPKVYNVSCFDSTSGKLCWSGSWEAKSAVDAIAQACLALEDRAAFIRVNDELPEIEASVPHPAKDMEGFTVRAEWAYYARPWQSRGPNDPPFEVVDR